MTKAEMIAKIEVIYTQPGVELTKTLEDFTFTENEGGRCTAAVTLTQEETAIFKCICDIKVQVRVLTTGGEPLMSDVYSLAYETCLFKEALK